MHRSIVSVLASFCVVVATAAARPAEAAGVDYGVRGGLHMSNLTGGPGYDAAKFRLGFQLGGGITVDLGKFAIAPELMYASQGVAVGEGNAQSRTGLNYLAIEGLFRYQVLQQAGVHVTAGPRLGYLINGVEQPRGVELPLDAFSRFSYGFTAGVGVEPIPNLIVQFRYSRDLSDLFTATSDREANQLLSIVGGFDF